MKDDPYSGIGPYGGAHISTNPDAPGAGMAARTIRKDPNLAAPYGRKSPVYPSAAEQRRRLRNARAALFARGCLVVSLFAVIYFLATFEFAALWFFGAGLVGFGTTCLFNYHHNAPDDGGVEDTWCAFFLARERRWLWVAVISSLALITLLVYLLERH